VVVGAVAVVVAVVVEGVVGAVLLLKWIQIYIK
jgi:hypothetical protein